MRREPEPGFQAHREWDRTMALDPAVPSPNPNPHHHLPPQSLALCARAKPAEARHTRRKVSEKAHATHPPATIQAEGPYGPVEWHLNARLRWPWHPWRPSLRQPARKHRTSPSESPQRPAERTE